MKFEIYKNKNNDYLIAEVRKNFMLNTVRKVCIVNQFEDLILSKNYLFKILQNNPSLSLSSEFYCSGINVPKNYNIIGEFDSPESLNVLLKKLYPEEFL